MTSLLLITLATVGLAMGPGANPVPVIFDTDLCGDCDDVLALAMLHALESRGECKIVAVTVSARHDLAAPFADALNTFYGRGGIPVGDVGEEGVVDRSTFLPLAEVRDGGRLRYPRRLGRDLGVNPPDATTVLREALAGQPDGSVVVVQVGFMTNLARLLDSKADAASPLSGGDLVRRKVKRLSLMAGAFAAVAGDPHYREYNVTRDVDSARLVATRWPSEAVWSGFEVGHALLYPHASMVRDYGYVPHHPVAEAYRLKNATPRDAPTWDLSSVLEAVYPDRGYFDLSAPGTVTVEPDGFTRFVEDAKGRHRYLKVGGGQVPRVVEAMVQLASQPPCPGVR